MSYHPLWTKGLAQQYVNDPTKYCSNLQRRQSTRPLKIIHSVGVTDHDAIFEIKHEHYLGVFRQGEHPAVIRLSLGTRPQTGGNAGTNASFALKIPRTGIHACDILAMFDFEGQTGGNMFQHILGTTISNPRFEADSEEPGDQFQKKLNKVGKNRAGLISLLQCAKFKVDGTNERVADETHASPFPWTLIFVPNPILYHLCASTYTNSLNIFECFNKASQEMHLRRAVS